MTLRIEFNADLAAFHANGSQALHELARKTEVLLRLENGTVEFSCQSGSVIATATLTGKRDNLIVLEKSYHQATFQPLGEMGLSVAHMTLRVVEKETETQAMIGVQQTSSERFKYQLFCSGVGYGLLALWGATCVAQMVKAPSTRKGGEGGMDLSDWMCVLVFFALLSRSLQLFIEALKSSSSVDPYVITRAVLVVTGEMCELCCFSLLVFLFAISVHGVRITSSGSMLGRLKYYMVAVNILQGAAVVGLWTLLVAAQTQGSKILHWAPTLQWVMQLILAVPVLVLALCVGVYGFLLVRRINASHDKTRKNQDARTQAATQAKMAAAKKVTYISCTLGGLFFVRAVMMIAVALNYTELYDPAKRDQNRLTIKLIAVFYNGIRILADGIILVQHGDKLRWTRETVLAVVRNCCSPLVYCFVHAKDKEIHHAKMDKERLIPDQRRNATMMNSHGDTGVC